MPPFDESSQYHDAQELFFELLDASPSEREQALSRRASTDPALAQRVASMLASDRGSHLDGPSGARRFGPYEEVRTVACGGMGEVVVAKRIDGEYEREVAIKLMRGEQASQQLLKRFLRERQMLAKLDHEYIARLLDGGTTEDGEPYLVMEYVEGEHADLYASKVELEERLQLFSSICEAVEHAHENGVVHRDLKPSNVLVRADGKPRLLDFGIARPDEETGDAEAAPLTRTGHRLFTPEFASPEQVRGESVTFQSDQFSLGILLYIFLSGESPWGNPRDLHELERSILTAEPAPPSRRLRGTARRRMPRDLDAIVMQCLEKRPNRRYLSVKELRKDLERHMAGKPVRARRIHTLERAGRYAMRNPLVPLAVVLLLTAGVAALVAWRSSVREELNREDLVTAVQDRIETAQEHWVEGFRDEADAELATALDDLDGLPDEHDLRGAVLVQMATQAGFRKEWYRAVELVDSAEAALEKGTGVDHEVNVQLLITRAKAFFYIPDGPPSEEHSLAASRYAREHLEPGNTFRVDAILNWANELRRKGRTEESIDLMSDVIAEVREYKPKHRVLGRFLNHRAVALAETGRAAEAIEEYRKVVKAVGWHHGEGHPAFGSVRLNLASALFKVGRRNEAQPEYEKAMVNSRLHGKPSFVAANAHFLARILLAQGDVEAARTHIEEAIELRTQLNLGIFIDRSRVILALVHEAAGRATEARAILEPLLTSPPDPQLDPMPEKAARVSFAPDVEADARRAWGTMLLGSGEEAEGLAQLERALELCKGAPWVDTVLQARIEAALDREKR